jgi:hypothetical protein
LSKLTPSQMEADRELAYLRPTLVYYASVRFRASN